MLETKIIIHSVSNFNRDIGKRAIRHENVKYIAITMKPKANNNKSEIIMLIDANREDDGGYQCK